MAGARDNPHDAVATDAAHRARAAGEHAPVRLGGERVDRQPRARRRRPSRISSADPYEPPTTNTFPNAGGVAIAGSRAAATEQAGHHTGGRDKHKSDPATHQNRRYAGPGTGPSGLATDRHPGFLPVRVRRPASPTTTTTPRRPPGSAATAPAWPSPESCSSAAPTPCASSARRPSSPHDRRTARAALTHTDARGRLPACSCRHHPVDGLHRRSGRTASPQRNPITHHVADPEPTRIADRDNAGRPRAPHPHHRPRPRHARRAKVPPLHGSA